jgi:hypothetical protein
MLIVGELRSFFPNDMLEGVPRVAATWTRRSMIVEVDLREAAADAQSDFSSIERVRP